MASDLSVSISVSAAVGGALSGLASLGKAMKTLETTTESLKRRQKELGDILTRNKDRLGVQSAKHLWQEYDKIARSIEKITAASAKLQRIQNLKTANSAQWQSLKGQWQAAAASAGTIAAPAKLAIDFESAMADVKKVVDFDTPQQFKEMQQDILKLTREIPMAGDELAAIVAAGGQSGVARQHLTGFASDAAKMGVAFDMAAEQAGEAMATLSNVLQIPIPKIGVLGDAINHLSDNANSKAADIVNVLTRVGSDTKQLGLTENQAAALGSTFLSMGKAPELAAQAIKGMTTSLSVLKAGGGKKELAALGLSTKEFADAMNKDAQGAILDLLKRVKQLPKDAQFPLLMKIFGKQYADDALLLANNVGEYNRQLDLLAEKDASGNLKYVGSMQREFANRSATTANQLRLLKNSLVELGINIGSILLPAVNEFAAMATRASHKLTDWANAHPVLTGYIVKAAMSLAAFVAGGWLVRVMANRLTAAFLNLSGSVNAFKSTVSLVSLVMKGGVIPADVPGRLGAFVRALSAARTAMMGFSLSSLAAMWPVVLVVGAVALAGWLIYKAWKPIKAFFAGLWDGLMQGLAPVMPALNQLAAAVKPVFDGIKASLSAVWETVQPFVQPLLDFFGDFFSTAQYAEGGARSFGEAVGLWIGQTVSAVVGWVVGKIEELKAAFSDGLSGIIRLIVNWSPIGAFYSAFAKVLSWFGIELPAKFTDFGANIISGLWNGLKAKIEQVKAWFSGVAGWFSAKFQKANDIHSPSRLFKRFGGYMMEGLHIGLNQGAGRPLAAVGAVAQNLQRRFTDNSGSLSADLAARLRANSDEFAAARASGGAVNIHFNPTINAPGGDPAQIQTALNLSLREFEKLFDRMMANRNRRSW